jgi:hypothetical protein
LTLGGCRETDTLSVQLGSLSDLFLSGSATMLEMREQEEMEENQRWLAASRPRTTPAKVVTPSVPSIRPPTTIHTAVRELSASKDNSDGSSSGRVKFAGGARRSSYLSVADSNWGGDEPTAALDGNIVSENAADIYGDQSFTAENEFVSQKRPVNDCLDDTSLDQPYKKVSQDHGQLEARSVGHSTVVTSHTTEQNSLQLYPVVHDLTQAGSPVKPASSGTSNSAAEVKQIPQVVLSS